MKRQQGFTIIELLIATTVFSVILLICSAGLISIGRSYLRTVTNTRTQDAARAISEEIGQSLQFSGSSSYVQAVDTSGSKGFCINEKRFSYQPNVMMDSANPNAAHVLSSDSSDPASGGSRPCEISPVIALDLKNSGATAGAYGLRDLLADNMRIVKLNITIVNGDMYKIQVKVASGPDDVFTTTNADTIACLPDRSSAQFCSVTELTTYVERRLK